MLKKKDIKQEHDRLDARLEEGNGTADERRELYGARQALGWVLEPDEYMAPLEACRIQK